jgi:hypothetical protein
MDRPVCIFTRLALRHSGRSLAVTPVRIDDPFTGSFTRTTEAGRHVRFVGKSECGMGGPTWGTFEISGLISLPRALPCCVIDEQLSVAAFQELEMAHTPEVVIHIRRLDGTVASRYTLPFGAYVFTSVTAQSVGVRDEWTGKTHELQIPDAMG